MATGRPDMKRWPRHKSGPKKGRLMSYEELEKAGKKPVYLTAQEDMFPDAPRKAKPRKAKPRATVALRRAAKAATETRKQSEERAERARKPASKRKAEKSAERAGEYSGIFGALARLWHTED